MSRVSFSINEFHENEKALEQLKTKLVTYSSKLKKLMLATSDPLLSYNQTYREIMITCQHSLTQMNWYPVAKLVKKVSNAMQVYYFVGLAELLFELNKEFSKCPSNEFQLVMAMVHLWSVKFPDKVKQQVEIE